MAKGKFNKMRWVLVGLLLMVSIGAWLVYRFYHQNFVAENVDTKGQEVFLFIKPGSDAKMVYEALLDLDVLIKPESFLELAERKNYKGANVVPGKYLLLDGMSTNALINHLRAGNGKIEVKVQFGQQRNIKQLAGVLARNIRPDSLEIFNWLSNEDSIGRYGFNAQTITAMFIPNTYFMNWEISTSQLMRRLASEYKKFWTEERRSKAQKIGLSQSEVCTMASIVYWETKKKEDMPIIAGVYMNRIKLGMPLQADPTLIFALDDYSIRRVLNVHKEIESPYNTYKYKGLPPGPILIPPIVYIDAVLNHSEHDYLYFVAKEDFSGYSYFAKTYKQHLVYARKFQRALNQRKVYR